MAAGCAFISGLMFHNYSCRVINTAGVAADAAVVGRQDFLDPRDPRVCFDLEKLREKGDHDAEEEAHGEHKGGGIKDNHFFLQIYLGIILNRGDYLFKFWK